MINVALKRHMCMLFLLKRHICILTAHSGSAGLHKSNRFNVRNRTGLAELEIYSPRVILKCFVSVICYHNSNIWLFGFISLYKNRLMGNRDVDIYTEICDNRICFNISVFVWTSRCSGIFHNFINCSMKTLKHFQRTTCARSHRYFSF